MNSKIIVLLHKHQNKILNIGILLFIIGILLYFGIVFNQTFFKLGGQLSQELASDLGSALSGLSGVLISGSSITFLILTFVGQIRASRIEQTETIFMKMVEFHRENVLNLKLMNDETNKIVEGQRVIEYLVKHYTVIYNIIKPIANVSPKLAVELTNLALFFSVNKLDSKIDTQKYEEVNFATIKARVRGEVHLAHFHRSIKEPNEQYLGHYFRNLYKAVKYIEDDKTLDSNEKKEFVNLLVAQLSSYEQTLLFLNSLSSLGENWNKELYLSKYNIVDHANLDIIESCTYLKSEYLKITQ